MIPSMEHFLIIDIVRRRTGQLFLVGVACAAAGFFILLFTSARYEVRTDFLVSQEESNTKDYYTLARSSEYIGKILGEVVYSERFIDTVVETGIVNAEFLPFDKKERLETWRDMVTIQKEADLGILHLTVASDASREAQKISQAIAQVLVEKNGRFLGTADKNIPVSMLSGPIAERNPSFQEIAIVVIAGFVFGVFLTVLGLFLRQEVFQRSSFPSEY